MLWLLTLLCTLAFWSVLALYGGLMKPVFALPAYALLALAGLLAVFARPRAGGQVAWCALALLLVWAGYLAWRISQAPHFAAVSAVAGQWVAGLLLLLLLATCLGEPKWRMRLIGAIIAFAAVAALIGLAQFFVDRTLRPFPWLSADFAAWYGGEVSRRGRGFYCNANHQAWLINFALFFSLAFLCWSRLRIEWKLILGFFLALFAVAQVVTLSRGGLVATAAGSLVFLCLSMGVLASRPTSRRLLLGLGLLLLLLGLAGIGFWVMTDNPVVQQRLLGLTNEGFRPEIWQAAFRQWQLEPLWGTGAGTSAGYLRLYRFSMGTSGNDPLFAHNDWLTLLAEYGWPGLVGALLLLIVFVRQTGLGLRKLSLAQWESGDSLQDNRVALLIGAGSFLGASAVHSFLDFNLHLPANFLLLALAVAIILSPGVAGVETSRPFFLAGGTLFSRLGAVLCAIGLLGLVYCNAPGEWLALRVENALAANQIEEALSCARQGVEQEPQSARLQFLLGEARRSWARQDGLSPFDRAQGNLAAAASYHRALALDPSYAIARTRLAQVLILTGRWGKARDEAVESVRRDPVFAVGYEQLGYLADREKRFREALEFYSLSRISSGWSVWVKDRYDYLFRNRGKLP